MGKFIDHPVKKVIREQWCKPLLTYISQTLGYKLTYLGLPGIDAIDILTWKDILNKVIAFDIGDYSKDDYNDKTAKEEIAKLNATLNDLENKGIIDNYSLYHGYIEEVVLKGMDRSGVSFKQNDIVTIYNLDFCNPLTAPVTVVDPFSGESASYYKMEVLRKLLEIQRDLSKSSQKSKFVLYLTVHSKFWENEAEKQFKGSDYSFYKSYSQSLSNIGLQERNIRLLRLYLTDTIRKQFCSCQFIPEFLPTLYYQGVGANQLLCFTIIGTYIKTASSTAPVNQNTKVLIKSKFLNPDKAGITILTQSGISENNTIIDPVALFKNLQSIKEYWLNIK